MGNIRTCAYPDCFYNNNLDNTCLIEKITVSATGVCETLFHCDDYSCADCRHFAVCTKQKKQRYLDENETSAQNK